MKKYALFAFNGEAMCFVHVLLNALEFHRKGYVVKVIIEGSATRLVKELADETQPFAKLYQRIKNEGLIDCICEACSSKMGAHDAAVEQNLTLCNELNGHPSIEKYVSMGYKIFTF